MAKQLTADLVLRDKYTATITKAARATEATMKANENLQRQVDRTASAYEAAKRREEKAQMAAGMAQQRAARMAEASSRAQARADQAQAAADAAKPGSAKQLKAAEQAAALTEKANKASKAAQRAATEYMRVQEQVRRAEDATKAAAEASRVAGDTMRTAAENAETGWQGFRQEVQLARKQLDAEAARKREIRFQNFKALKGIQAVTKALKPIRDKAVNITAKTANFMARLKPLAQGVEKLAKTAWTVTLRIKDSVSAGLQKIGNTVGSMARNIGIAVAGAAAAAATAAVKALQAGAKMEDYEVSMRHFIKINNPAMDDAALQDATKTYTGWLSQYAASTPFSIADAMQSGSRAVGVANGNLDAAKALVTLSGNMAALIPGKSPIDAMEALADAQMGEFERLKEFNVKLNQDLLKKAGGDLSKVVIPDTGLTLWETFLGGAEAKASTTSGSVSTIMGELEGAFADAGRTINESLKPALEDLRKVIPGISNALRRIGTWAAPYIARAADALVKLLENVELDKFTANLESGVHAVKDWATPIVQPLLDSLSRLSGWLSTDKGSVETLFTTVSSGVRDTLSNMSMLLGEIVGFGVDHGIDIANGAGKVFSDIRNAIDSAIGLMGSLVEKVDANWTSIGSTLRTVYDNTIGLVLGKLSEMLVTVRGGIENLDTSEGSGFSKFLRSIEKVAEVFGKIAGWILDSVNVGLQWIWDHSDTIFGGLAAVIETATAPFTAIAEAIQTVIDKILEVKRQWDLFQQGIMPGGVPGERVELPPDVAEKVKQQAADEEAMRDWASQGLIPVVEGWKPIAEAPGAEGIGGTGVTLPPATAGWTPEGAGLTQNKTVNNNNVFNINGVTNPDEIAQIIADKLDEADQKTD